MKTIVIPQFYRGPSGQKGLYNRQEVGLARAFAALGCRAVVLYPEPGAKAPKVETPEPNVKICYLPAVAFGTQALYKSWQILLDEQADAVHVMGDNSLGVPGLYRFCEKHGIVFYSQLGALKSTSNHAIVRGVMDLLLRRNLTVYRKTPTYAKTPAVAAELESLGVPCCGLMPVGLDTAIIPTIPGSKAMIRRELNINEQVKVLAFPRLAVIADGEFLYRMLPVKIAGEKVVDPVHVACVVHVAVAIQVGEAYVPAAAVFHDPGNQTAGERQLRSPKGAGNHNAAFSGKNHVPGIPIHQYPQADRAGALVARLIVDHHGAGVGDPGGGQRPGFDADGFSQLRKPVDLHPVPGHRPEQPVAFQRVRKLVAVPPRDLLREI